MHLPLERPGEPRWVPPRGRWVSELSLGRVPRMSCSHSFIQQGRCWLPGVLLGMVRPMHPEMQPKGTEMQVVKSGKLYVWC